MSAADLQQDAAPAAAHDVAPIEPGHVMPRKQYEELTGVANMKNSTSDAVDLGASAGKAAVTLVVEVDTTQLDAALAKAEQLKVALAGLMPVPANALSVSVADVERLAVRTFATDQVTS